MTSKQRSCDSWKYKPASCAVGGDAVAIKVAAKRSAAGCVLNQSYGLKAGKAWVDKGCRATFTVYYVKNSKWLCIKISSEAC